MQYRDLSVKTKYGFMSLVQRVGHLGLLYYSNASSFEIILMISWLVGHDEDYSFIVDREPDRDIS